MILCLVIATEIGAEITMGILLEIPMEIAALDGVKPDDETPDGVTLDDVKLDGVTHEIVIDSR